MFRLLGLICLLVFSISGIARAGNPEVDVLRQQIKTLREEEKATIKYIRETYKAIIANKRLDEHERAGLRKKLADEERQSLSLATGKDQKEKIRSNYGNLRKLLMGEMRLDTGAIRQLHEQETEHIRNVQAVYKAKILELEEAIKAATQAKSAGNRRKK
jgi:hypothetical protein